MKALCVGDLHLEQGANLGAPGERLAEQEAVWDRALELSRETHCDCVLFAGDAWERRAPTPDGYLAFVRPLVRHRNAGGARVIAIPGNHDLQALDAGAALDVVAAAGLIELHRLPMTVDVGGIAISCLPWAPVHQLVGKAERSTSRDEINQQAARRIEEVAAHLGALAHTAGTPSVLLTHFAISNTYTATGADVGIFREPVLDSSVIGGGHVAVVAGHIHKRQQFSDCDFYVGSLTPLNFGETGEHGITFLHVDAADGEACADFVDIESREFVTWDLDEDETSRLADEGGLVMVPLDGAYLKIRYACTDEQAARIDQRALRQQALDHGAHRVWIHETVTRTARSRTVEMPDEMSDLHALEIYLDGAHELEPGELDRLLERATPYLQAAR